MKAAWSVAILRRREETQRIFSVVVADFLEVLECFIFVCDDDEVRRREILQSKRDFITLRREHGLPS